MIAMMDLKGLFNTLSFKIDRRILCFVKQNVQNILVYAGNTGVAIFSRINVLSILYIVFNFSRCLKNEYSFI